MGDGRLREVVAHGGLTVCSLIMIIFPFSLFQALLIFQSSGTSESRASLRLGLDRRLVILPFL